MTSSLYWTQWMCLPPRPQTLYERCRSPYMFSIYFYILSVLQGQMDAFAEPHVWPSDYQALPGWSDQSRLLLPPLGCCSRGPHQAPRHRSRFWGLGVDGLCTDQRGARSQWGKKGPATGCPSDLPGRQPSLHPQTKQMGLEKVWKS